MGSHSGTAEDSSLPWFDTLLLGVWFPALGWTVFIWLQGVTKRNWRCEELLAQWQCVTYRSESSTTPLTEHQIWNTLFVSLNTWVQESYADAERECTVFCVESGETVCSRTQLIQFWGQKMNLWIIIFRIMLFSQYIMLVCYMLSWYN